MSLAFDVLRAERAHLVAAQLRGAWLEAVLGNADAEDVTDAWLAYRRARRRVKQLDAAIQAEVEAQS